ncbi:uncharacterized protein GGS25DRAFT_277217 [Hypoxylon fragiforme]|uniref:uncharacterized protein n=1 Tax=Hypoxylon fragiforme TaxID=63214 RepID=UPI0020C6C071|nr:uncharacterized protein GGS25DRAFT_277217 [Hypoxylon fragiforme]KAI2608448.1 hypothetical protein GGS25DRAFT_277217 [Hypoxylon fragiforme]
MASITVDEKSSKPNPLAICTQQLLAPDHNKSPELGMELRRNSSLSTPNSASAPNGFDTDVEAMMPVKSSEYLNKTTTSNPKLKSDCQVWPGQDHWRQKARAAKMNNRSCQCLAHLSHRNRIIAKILIVFLIVGVAVGVGFGISKPLGAGIWQPKDH